MENYYDQPHIKFLKKCMADDRTLLDADLVSTTFSAVPQYRIAVTRTLEIKEAILEQDAKRFGNTSPPSPLVELLLVQYQHRPGFDPAWLN